MQRQQEREPDTRQKPPRPRRSVGELLAAWLLILWGASCAYVIAPYFLVIIRRELGEFSRSVALSTVLGFLQAFLCFIAGFTTLLCNYRLAKWSLITTGLCWIGLAIANLTIDPVAGIMEMWILLWSLVYSLVSLLFFFLGRWLGQQEDSDA